MPPRDLDLSHPRSVHIVGVGGAGMSAIATVLARMGHVVTGSDLKESASTERLRLAGVEVSIGHAAEHVPMSAEAVVVSTAIPMSNPEVVAALARDVPVLRRADALRALVATRRSIAVAGSHGKTTTSSMLALCLRAAGWQPSFLIGGDLNEVGTNAAYDEGEWLVVEADESDGTFLEIAPEAVVVTNVEPDHLDHYGGFPALVDGFRRFLERVPGVRVVCADDAVARELAAAVPGASTYGWHDAADYRLRDYEGSRAGSRFVLEHHGEAIGVIELPTPGRHNALNAAGAAAAALEIGVPFDDVRRALGGFGGVARRFQFRGEIDGVTLVDDYAHLPTEVAAALGAAREGGWGRVVAVFQPHRYTRTASLWRDFADAFVDADALVLTDVYPAGEAPVPGVSGRLVLRAVLDAHPAAQVRYLPRHADVVAHGLALARPGDVILTLGAGDLTTVPDEWLREDRDARRAVGHVNLDRVTSDLVACAPGAVTRNASVAELTTYRVGGPVAVLVRVNDEATLTAIASVLHRARVSRDEQPPVLVIGRGSNLLVADQGFAGVAVVLGGAFETIDLEPEHGVVRAGAAVPLPVLARRAAAAGLTGLEFFVGIPGSVGGAVRMNAGGHGRETREVLRAAWVVDLGSPVPEAVVRETAALDFAYRHSNIGATQIVTRAELTVTSDDIAACETRIADIVRWRREHQPGGSNAGSVFRNPPGDSAGRLIDEAGLKGLRVGGAVVSDKHANFFQAEPGATAMDVVHLIATVQARVEAASGVRLVPELHLVGFAPSDVPSCTTSDHTNDQTNDQTNEMSERNGS